MGCYVSSLYCCKTAPTAVSDASVMRQVGPLAVEYEKRVALANASFVSLKTVKAASLQVSV